MGSCFTALGLYEYRSYPRSTGWNRQSGGLGDVDRRVDVPIQNGPASSAFPYADMEGLGAILDAALRADLGGRLEPPDAVEGPAELRGLVLQHRDERRPSGVVDGLGQACTGESLDRQVLHGNRLVLANDPCGELVVELAPCVGDLRVSAGGPASAR